MSSQEIRSVIVPITEAEILIPNATVAEVMSFVEPQPIEDSPAWVLGSFLWRGWQVPLISFAVLTETTALESTRNARICVTKSLTGNDRMPYFAILAQAFPRLTTISDTGLIEVPSSHKPIAVAGRLVIDEREVVVPDLDRLGHLVAHAAFGALPLTRHRIRSDLRADSAPSQDNAADLPPQAS